MLDVEYTVPLVYIYMSLCVAIATTMDSQQMYSYYSNTCRGNTDMKV